MQYIYIEFFLIHFWIKINFDITGGQIRSYRLILHDLLYVSVWVFDR